MTKSKFVAIVVTKSNFKNCNYIELPVVEFLGTLISLEVPNLGFNKKGEPQGTQKVTTDFNLKEVVCIKEKRS